MAQKNPNKIKNGSPVATVIIYFILILLAFICIYPLWYVAVISVSTPITAVKMDAYFLPKGFYTGSYAKLFKDVKFWVTYGNTIIYATTCCVGMLITCAMCAYPLTSPLLKGKRLIVFFILIPMYFSGGLIPQYIWMSKLGMYNTRWAIIFPGIVSMWYIILTRTYFATIPEELRESARIDGANNYQILWNVYVPTSKPIMAVIAIYTIVAQWNSWYAASIYLAKQELQPVQLYLRRILILQQQMSNEQNANKGGTGESQEEAMQMMLAADQTKYTMIVVSSLPILVIYPFFQRYFVKGVMVGSLKG